MKKVSFTERMVHAVGYEVFAVLLCAPLLSWVLGKSLATAGGLAVTLSVIAMAWNVAYNALIERVVQTERVAWKPWTRVAHGLGFEAGLVVWCLPVAAWMLDISLLQAFMVELGFFVIILPYTVVYNWAFDKARHYVVQRQAAA
ncbi:multidrug/biocide efflux PACE transporter [Pseudomonas sp. ITEM 17296]|uniref:multidrug/biocide efflux PACE transporter n=1 Tax=Pseudomonas sp. ITEM 17296 TaxID=2790281 RepID=UPI002380036A|nr:multidrug/biocide efflux PACE transporter [Pseudomonas sp. ITEM 17296]MDE4538463.1 multidrug/biocide efflux PACE transporter [Pseudomonas sp. ITEM 17296]